MSFVDKLKFDSNGLIPAIIQDAGNHRVLMMAWMNRASLEKTIETGKTHFWSRSRQKFWMKGESSGHVQVVKDIAFDCDGDTLLIQFGHNDANQAKPERYTPIPDYEANLKHFIAVARMAHAQPVLITPVTRRAFKDGHVVPSFPTYSAAAKRVADETKVPLIDLAALSERWIDALGPDGSKRYYLHYAKGEGLPGYKDAVDDDTHFSELGARRIADMVAGGLAATGLPIAGHVLTDRPALRRSNKLFRVPRSCSPDP